MNFYIKHHAYYCGIDLHAKKMYVCILDRDNQIKIHLNIKTDPNDFLKSISPCQEDIVIGVECMFCWHWLADLSAEHELPFVLGHALYMKAIYGGKTKNDKIYSYKIATLLRGGTFPRAYTYPQGWRAKQDLLRRRMYISRRTRELVAHIRNTNTQYNGQHQLPLDRILYYQITCQDLVQFDPIESIMVVNCILLSEYDLN